LLQQRRQLPEDDGDVEDEQPANPASVQEGEP
jgi:hypothetical protein